MRRLAALALCVLATPAMAGAPPADVRPGPDVGWIVLGVQPERTRMEIDRPIMRSGRIRRFAIDLNAEYSKDGFIVWKVKPDTVYGVAASALMWGKSIFGIRYMACGHAPTFEAGAGKVLYVGSLSYRGVGSGSTGGALEFQEAFSQTDDIESARAFLKTHYPGLADSLEHGAMEMTPIDRAC